MACGQWKGERSEGHRDESLAVTPFLFCPWWSGWSGTSGHISQVRSN